MRTRPPLRLLACAAVLAVAACPHAPQTDVLFQYTPFQALNVGVMDGALTVRELLRHGSLGLGTYDGLDGEMIVVDGTAYRAALTGAITRPAPEAEIPWAMVCRFAADAEFGLDTGMDYPGLRDALTARLVSPNLFHAFRIDGTFAYLKVRSVPKQEPPYPSLAEVVAQQHVYELEDAEGTIVGFYGPPYCGGTSVPGYHLHFITADRTQGGHVLELTLGPNTVRMDALGRLELWAPDAGDFLTADLAVDAENPL